MAKSKHPAARTNKAPSGSTIAGPSGPVTTAFNPSNPLGSITSDIFAGFLNDLAKSFGAGSVKDMWIRGGLIIFGGILVIIGILILVAPAASKVAQSPVGQAGIEAAAPELGITTSALGSGRQQTQAMARQRARTQASRAKSESVRAGAAQSRAATQAAREQRLSGP